MYVLDLDEKSLKQTGKLIYRVKVADINLTSGEWEEFVQWMEWIDGYEL